MKHCKVVAFYRRGGKMENNLSVKPKNNTMQTVDRALDLIGYLANARDGLTVADLSRLLQITRTTTYTVLNSLMNQGYVEQVQKTGRYMIGYRFFAIGSVYQYQFPFISIAKKYLNHLDPRFQVNISVLKPHMQLLILLARESAFVPSINPIRIRPAYACASGKMLLSYLSDRELDALLQNTEFHSFTSSTITSPDQLWQEINRIRQQGYAKETDEMILGRGCIAFPILDASQNAIAAISLSGKTEALESDNARLIGVLRDVAFAVSTELGYDIVTSKRRRNRVPF